MLYQFYIAIFSPYLHSQSSLPDGDSAHARHSLSKLNSALTNSQNLL